MTTGIQAINGAYFIVGGRRNERLTDVVLQTGDHREDIVLYKEGIGGGVQLYADDFRHRGHHQGASVRTRFAGKCDLQPNTEAAASFGGRDVLIKHWE